MIKHIVGNIFTTKKQTIVNTVNCVGVMGAGIALEFRLRYPDMYQKYVQLCSQNLIDIGKLWIYKTEKKRILNFPTKKHWKAPTKEIYLHKGLEKFSMTYKEKGITSIAFPLLGASNGGLSKENSLSIMKDYLSKCDIDIEIYEYSPLVYDDLFLNFKDIWNSKSLHELSNESGISLKYIERINAGLDLENIRTLSQLASIKGIGFKTLEKSFYYVNNSSKQNTLNF
ncbi:MAG: macro domain-containing protein [Candidatus Kapaibacterium sp.]